MPLYYFRCPVCSAEKSVLISVTRRDEDRPFCTECQDAGEQSYPVRMYRIPTSPAAPRKTTRDVSKDYVIGNPIKD